MRFFNRQRHSIAAALMLLLAMSAIGIGINEWMSGVTVRGALGVLLGGLFVAAAVMFALRQISRPIQKRRRQSGPRSTRR
jgi:hypothetical protein